MESEVRNLYSLLAKLPTCHLIKTFSIQFVVTNNKKIVSEICRFLYHMLKTC